MRILLTADAELPVPPKLYGGIERIIDSLVRRYRGLGHQVGLAAHRDSRVPTDEFFAWPGYSNTRSRDSWRNTAALRRAVRAFQPDVVHSFSRLLWLFPLVADGRPKIMSYQREPTGRTVAWSRRLHGPRLQFTGCSNYICKNGYRRGGGHWTAIPNFVDPEAYTFVPHVSDDAPLVFLSRIERIKGAHTAIEIAKNSGRRLTIAGNRIEHGEGAQYWTEFIAPHIGKDGIEYVGPVNDRQKNELLGKAAAMVVPIEWNEPFGIVFAESLACGTPVISCPRGALPEIVEDGVHGFHIRTSSEGVAAIGRLKSIERKACRARLEERFSCSVVADAYLGLYRRMLGNGQSDGGLTGRTGPRHRSEAGQESRTSSLCIGS